ncbi:helix-turn-helix domain-containing protein [Microbacterium oryzae]|uniref:ArsR family transcriptional regulator n=1 Tax=Microbacterium oryzae TaxID=743009 RepID=A0A6I6DVM6_9MICO|nr:helix-turn-helix domain-containing protein [Microbacterium oryzae]QGU28136.1 ArsR family transcriptional regulator [Microbacterium oryzae]
MADSEASQRRSGRTLPAKQLKAMAHPARLDILDGVARRGFARAADLASDLGLPANQVSFHLRVLADAGLIEEAPEHARDRRDRVWKPVEETWQLGTPEHPMEDERLGGVVLHGIAAQHQDLLRRVVEWAPEYTSGRTAEVHGTLNQHSAWLTEGEARDLLVRIGDLIEEARTRHEPGEEGVRYWAIDVLAADDAI